MTIICFFAGHKFVSTGTVLFGLAPATPVCSRYGKYAGNKKTEDKENQDGK